MKYCYGAVANEKMKKKKEKAQQNDNVSRYIKECEHTSDRSEKQITNRLWVLLSWASE